MEHDNGNKGKRPSENRCRPSPRCITKHFTLQGYTSLQTKIARSHKGIDKLMQDALAELRFADGEYGFHRRCIQARSGAMVVRLGSCVGRQRLMRGCRHRSGQRTGEDPHHHSRKQSWPRTTMSETIVGQPMKQCPHRFTRQKRRNT